MTQPSDRQAAAAYTRESVEAYLEAAAAERMRIELAIAEARARTERARRKEERLRSLGGESGSEGDRGQQPAPTESDRPAKMVVDEFQMSMTVADGEWLQAGAGAVVAHD